MSNAMENKTPIADNHSRRVLRAVLVTSVMLGVHFVALSVVVFFSVSVVPIHAEVFAIYEVELPVITVTLINHSNEVLKYWYLFPLLLLFFDGPILFFFQYCAPRWGWLKACWFTGWLVAALFYLAWGIIAISIGHKVIHDAQLGGVL
jgi:type II secretory pathway component PulF